jgi:hypothetical protein
LMNRFVSVFMFVSLRVKSSAERLNV